MKKEGYPEQHFEFQEIDRAHWERIKARSAKYLSMKFSDFMGETGGDLNISWRYVPVAKMLFCRVIRWPKYWKAYYPNDLLALVVYGPIKGGKRVD